LHACAWNGIEERGPELESEKFEPNQIDTDLSKKRRQGRQYSASHSLPRIGNFMNKASSLLIGLVLAATSVVSVAQAPAAQSPDPIVQRRMDDKAANEAASMKKAAADHEAKAAKKAAEKQAKEEKKAAALKEAEAKKEAKAAKKAAEKEEKAKKAEAKKKAKEEKAKADAEAKAMKAEAKAKQDKALSETPAVKN
jgi:hypothetical protein